MNQRDKELLDKQLRWLIPAPRRGGLMAAVIVIFLFGMTLGSFFPHVSP